MNIFTRLGVWLDDKNVKESHFDQWTKRIEALETKEQIPPQLIRDLAILKQQMDRMELYVGLKRDAQAVQVQGTPKIS